MRGGGGSSSRCSSSSKQANKGGANIGLDVNDDHHHTKLKQDHQPHLSGAYIRSLVKQLTSSKPKDHSNPTLNPKDQDSTSSTSVDHHGFLNNNTQNSHETQQTHQPQQHKKQVRRRLHTSRPYQERLLNMAEARREIVTALKFHRASMKQANEQQQHQQQQSPQTIQTSLDDELAKMKSSTKRNPRIYPSTTQNDLSYSTSFACAPPIHYPPPTTSTAANTFPWPCSPAVKTDSFNYPALPNQTLGLNLNLHDFHNLDTTFYNNNNNPSIYASSSLISTMKEEATPSLVISPEPAGVEAGGELHSMTTMEDDEMAEMRSIGEQHQMEWNDALNLVTSAWWFKFLKAMEIRQEDKGGEDEHGFQHPFDELMDFPSWLNPNDACFHQHFDDYSCFQDPDLPW